MNDQDNKVSLPARAWLVLAIILALAASWAAGVLATRSADAALAREAQVSANLFDAVLRNVLERYRALPMVLASDGDVAAVLARPDTAAARRLDARLAMLARRTNAAAIYVIAANGRTIAASNAGQKLSFVGRDFTFRAYFAEAMARGRGEQFALGTTTNQPGLYLSARVDVGGKPVGVVVTKIDFSAVERQWRRTPTPVFVTDKAGIVIITSVEPWRFSPEPALALAAHPDHPVHLKANVPGRPPGEYVRARVRTGMTDWTLNLLQPAGPAADAAATAASTLTLMTAALLILAGWWWLRRRTRAARQAAARAAAQADLEARVAERTSELRAANERLLTEIEERRRAEAALLLLHLELEQANRLTTLGQIAAGVTHEINQPVAAIAAWAHNARALLARGSTGEVEAALGTIQGLTERIGRITGELRDFARKSDEPPKAVQLAEAIAGTQMLVGTRSGSGAMAIDSSGVPDDLAVLADRTRLEQVLVNLLRNAAEAGASRVAITACHDADGVMVVVKVRDDGPGVPPAIAAALFTPFQTSKPTGLGLGLVISRDICRAMGGDLVLEPADRGSVFRITLPAAGA